LGIDVYVLRARYCLGACIRGRRANQVALVLFGMVSVSMRSSLSRVCLSSGSVKIVVALLGICFR
jgi:hypothetical protein